MTRKSPRPLKIAFIKGNKEVFINKITGDEKPHGCKISVLVLWPNGFSSFCSWNSVIRVTNVEPSLTGRGAIRLEDGGKSARPRSRLPITKLLFKFLSFSGPSHRRSRVMVKLYETHGRRSTRVVLGHSCGTLAVMYLQRGPPIAENNPTIERIERTVSPSDSGMH